MANRTAMPVAEAVASPPSLISVLHGLGEHVAAGYLACPQEPPVVRFARAVVSHLEHVDLPPYHGEPLYPCSPSLWARGAAVEWHYSSCLGYSPERLREKLDATDDPREQQALEAVHEALKDYPHFGGYTHSIPNYRRLLQEGLASYGERLARSRGVAERRGEAERVDFCRAMEILLAGLAAFHRRVLEHLSAWELDSPEEESVGTRLVASESSSEGGGRDESRPYGNGGTVAARRALEESVGTRLVASESSSEGGGRDESRPYGNGGTVAAREALEESVGTRLVASESSSEGGGRDESRPYGNGGAEEARQALVAALEQAPFSPAQSFYQGLVAVNFILYLDGPDDLGRLDQDLWPLFEADRAAGRVSDQQAVEWLRRLWQNMDLNGAWNVALGGLLESGASGLTDLTRLCLRAAHKMRRPNLALRLHRGASDETWDAALDCIFSGAGLPALYNEEAYLAAVRGAHLGVSEKDLPDFAFGGCTELMVHGKSNCGSLEGDVNLPLVLVQTLHEHLRHASSFEELLSAYKRDLVAHLRDLTASWDANQAGKAAWQPQVIRSLLIDDCLDNAREYNAGGARYNWCVVNVMGLANVIDSLAAVREVVFERSDATAGEPTVARPSRSCEPGELLAAPATEHDRDGHATTVPRPSRSCEPGELLAALDADFVGHEDLRRRLEACPRFGNDDPRADDLAEEVSDFVFSELRRYAPWRGGRYLPACLMFTTYAYFGKPVGATPDGRRAGAPIADSAGAMQGRDTHGPTALLRSVARIKHHLAPGTLVVNARFSRKLFVGPRTRAKLRQLIRTYFDLGGMQVQINVVDQATLEDAYAHPERYGDLIIRVGGYSEYWTHLDDDLRRSILERVEHE